jgi:perosamine synthetase
MDDIMDIARKYGLYVIEDAAEALGSEYKGRKAGTIGDIGVFSFHGAKTCTTGEGGMLITNNPELFITAATLNNSGRNPESKKAFYAERIGYKYKISNFQAALGLAQLERAEELIERKRQIFYEYKKKLAGLPISMNPEPIHVKNSFWLPGVVFDESLNIDRQKLIDFFKEENIDIRPFFYPISSLPMFEKKNENEIAYGLYSRGINLPSYHDITEEEMDYICELLKKIIKGEKR